jgi:hypothetical protein
VWRANAAGMHCDVWQFALPKARGNRQRTARQACAQKGAGIMLDSLITKNDLQVRSMHFVEGHTSEKENSHYHRLSKYDKETGAIVKLSPFVQKHLDELKRQEEGTVSAPVVPGIKVVSNRYVPIPPYEPPTPKCKGDAPKFTARLVPERTDLAVKLRKLGAKAENISWLERQGAQ